ncbi:MAG TPA: hypothetical protein VMS64_09595 [Candidatus Methylomirabilis sp.]|nr:hypothetical protein [Candidatus Methylomirabilis sp.]
MRGFEDTIASELAWLLRAGAPSRAVRLTVRELVVARIERGPLDAREVSDAVEATVRAACRLVREFDASGDLVETVCRSALEAVRGHGGETARWLPDVTSTAIVILDELARERPDDATWRWIARRLSWW